MVKEDTEDDAFRVQEDEETQEPLLGTKSQQPFISQGVGIKPKKEIFEMAREQPRDVCAELMGDWGRWQLGAVSIIYLSKIPAAWFMACIIFTAPAPWYREYWCDLNNQAIVNNVSVERLHHPLKLNADGSMREDYCHVHIDNDVENKSDPNYWILDMLDSIRDNLTESSSTVPCEKFKFKLDPVTTLITQYDLVCFQSILIAVSQCFHLFGVLVGGVIATELMKFFSPRRVMMLGMVLQIPIGVSTGFVPWFWLHVFLRFLSAVCCAITFTPCGVIMGDIVGGRPKKIVAANFESSWSIGVILLPAIGYFTNTWGEIYLAISLPTILLMVLWVWLPDSPRWHLERGNIDATRPILENAAKNNGTIIPDNFEELLKAQAKNLIGKKKEESMSTWMQLLSIKGAPLKIIIVFMAWSLIFTTYYGTLLNIRSFGRKYLFFTTAVAGLCEIVGCLLGFVYIMWSKRKWTYVGLIATVTGILNSAIWLMPTYVDGSHMLPHLMTIAMINKVAISACLCVLTTCTVELFPLPHKKRVVFMSTVMARIVFITAPLIGFMVMFGDGVPLSFFGVMTIISGLCTMVLTPLQDTDRLPDIPNIWTVKMSASEL